MNGFLQVFYIIFSALLLSAGIPNEILHLGSPILGLFSLVPFYLALRSAKTFKRAGLLTGLHFGLMQLLSSFWLGNFKDFAIFTLGAPTVAYALEGYMFGTFFHGALAFLDFTPEEAALQDMSFRGAAKTLKRVLFFTAIYSIWEWTKSVGFLAYPWGTLVMTSFQSPLLIQIVDITGTWGISFLWSLFAATFAEGIMLFSAYQPRLDKLVKRMYLCIAAITASLFAVSFVYGAVQYIRPIKPVKTANIAIIQHNTDSWFEEGDSPSVISAQKMTTQALQGNVKPDVVCWSESILNYAFPDSYFYYQTSPSKQPVIQFMKKAGVPFAVGAPLYFIENGKQKFYNGAVVFDKDTNIIGMSGKIHLVPFAEYIPFMDNPWFKKTMDTLVGFSDGWSKWDKYIVYEVPLQAGGNLRFSVPICFEDAFPDICRGFYKTGAEVLMSISNDSWSNLKSAEYQHFVIAAFRAIELRTTLVRTTNSGYSGVVDAKGRIIADLPLFEEAAIVAPVPIYEHKPTVYAQLGDWIVILFMLLLVAYFAECIIETYKKH